MSVEKGLWLLGKEAEEHSAQEHLTAPVEQNGEASLNFNCGTMLSASPFTSRCTKPSLLFFLISLLPNECAHLICSLISFAAISQALEETWSFDFAI